MDYQTLIYIINDRIHNYEDQLLSFVYDDYNLSLSSLNNLRMRVTKKTDIYTMKLKRIIRKKLLDICSVEERHCIRNLYFGRNYGEKPFMKYGYDFTDLLVFSL